MYIKTGEGSFVSVLQIVEIHPIDEHCCKVEMVNGSMRSFGAHARLLAEHIDGLHREASERASHRIAHAVSYAAEHLPAAAPPQRAVARAARKRRA